MIKIFRKNKYSILRKISNFSYIAIFVLVFTVPLMVGAGGVGAGNDGGGVGAGNDGGGVGAGNSPSVQINTSIDNPLGDNIKDIPSFIKAVITAVLYIGIPIVALAIIYTGFLFVSAQGNPEKLTKAKKALLYTLIGAVLLLGAFVIANAIQSTVNEIKKGA